MKLRFVSKNKFKIKEISQILECSNIEVIPFEREIEELQTLDVKKLVKDKVMKAFEIIGKPVFVEHTGLYIKHLNNFPGGLTQIFWDSLRADKFAHMIGNLADSTTIARTIIGYCDSKEIYFFSGEIEGKISKIPRGDSDFQWDCVFIPTGESMTFAEMGDKKNMISMRKKAVIKFKEHLCQK